MKHLNKFCKWFSIGNVCAAIIALASVLFHKAHQDYGWKAVLVAGYFCVFFAAGIIYILNDIDPNDH